jgi:hypothetical protein
MINLKRRENLKKLCIVSLGLVSFGFLGNKFMPDSFKYEYLPEKENTIKNNRGQTMVVMNG